MLGEAGKEQSRSAIIYSLAFLINLAASWLFGLSDSEQSYLFTRSVLVAIKYVLLSNIASVSSLSNITEIRL